MTTEEAEEGGREGGVGTGGEEVELAVRPAAFLLWTPMTVKRRCFLCCVLLCVRAWMWSE